MEINNLLLKHYLRNVMFITGTSYAGKSTMVKMLAEKYKLIHCVENYDCQVAVMLSPQSMSVEHFFDRDDPDKAFIKEQIMKSDNPEKTMENYLACIAKINSKEHYDELANSGFFTIMRKDTETDTKLENLEILARNFGL